MELDNWTKRLPEEFPPASRVWIYQGERPFSAEEAVSLREELRQFYAGWTSHGRPARGWADIFFDRFIVVMADDTTDRLCGSAVDESLRFIQALESRYGFRLLDRMRLAFLVNDQVKSWLLGEIPQALERGEIDRDTLFFDQSVTTRAEMESRWLLPLGQSWLANRFRLSGQPA